MFARFNKAFETVEKDVGKVTYPRGWAGELDEKTFAAAKKAGALVPDLNVGKAEAQGKSSDEASGAKAKSAAAMKKAEDEATAARKKADDEIAKARDDVAAALAQSEADIQKAKDDAADEIARIGDVVTAHQKVAAAKVAILSAGTDTVAKDKAEADLKAAEAELAKLQV